MHVHIASAVTGIDACHMESSCWEAEALLQITSIESE